MKIAMVCHKYGMSIHDPIFTPTGFLMIAAIFKRDGHDVTWFNYNLQDYDFESMVKGMDAVCFTGFEPFLPFIIRDAAIAKSMGIKTILGGALATFLPDEMLKHVDTVVVGEGDDVTEQALAGTGKIQGTKPDLDLLPFPDVEGFGIEEYNKIHNPVWLNVLTTRGCPFAGCRFCAHTCYYQARGLDNVFAEIDLYREKYNPEIIAFQDNALNTSKKRFMAICAGMKERKLHWGTALRVDPWDDEMAMAAKDSGFVQAIIGVESFIQEKLDRMNKRITVGQIFRCLDSFHKHDLPYYGNILVGFPWETYREAVDEIRNIPVGYNVFPGMVQPFVGTEYRGRNMTDDECKNLDTLFRGYAEHRGMLCYPEVTAT